MACYFVTESVKGAAEKTKDRVSGEGTEGCVGEKIDEAVVSVKNPLTQTVGSTCKPYIKEEKLCLDGQLFFWLLQ